MSTIVKTLKDLVNPKNFIESTWLFGTISLFLAFYGPRLHPKLPDNLRNLFNNGLFRGVVIFLIVFISQRDMGMALTITIIFLVFMNLLQTSQILTDVEEEFTERYYSFGAPVANCGNYTNDREKFGGPIYKMFK